MKLSPSLCTFPPIDYYQALALLSLSLHQLFLQVVPRFLGMNALVDDGEGDREMGGEAARERRRSSFGLMQRAEEYVLKQPRSEMMFDRQRERHGLTRSFGKSSLPLGHGILQSAITLTD